MHSFSRRAFGASTLALAAGCATGTPTNDGGVVIVGRHAAIGAFGLDLTAGDSSVSPGDDFFRYANGRWLDTTEIPSDQRSWARLSSSAKSRTATSG